VSPWPTALRRYEYDYVRHPGVLPFDGSASDTLTAIQPPEHRIIVVYKAGWQLLVDKEDSRAQVFAVAGGAVADDIRAYQRAQARSRPFHRASQRVSYMR
jgi:hypothetical protein